MYDRFQALWIYEYMFSIEIETSGICNGFPYLFFALLNVRNDRKASSRSGIVDSRGDSLGNPTLVIAP